MPIEGWERVALLHDTEGDDGAVVAAGTVGTCYGFRGAAVLVDVDGQTLEVEEWEVRIVRYAAKSPTRRKS